MGFYSQLIFPRLCDFVLDRPFVAKHRRELLSTVDGDVLEIGFGTGLNLAYYPPGLPSQKQSPYIKNGYNNEWHSDKDHRQCQSHVKNGLRYFLVFLQLPPTFVAATIVRHRVGPLICVVNTKSGARVGAPWTFVWQSK